MMALSSIKIAASPSGLALKKVTMIPGALTALSEEFSPEAVEEADSLLQ